MKERIIYDEEKGEWNVRIGDMIFFKNRLWLIKRINKSWLHRHPYIQVITYAQKIFDESIKIIIKIYDYEAKKIKIYYKREKIS
jgi:hypothetical protein